MVGVANPTKTQQRDRFAMFQWLIHFLNQGAVDRSHSRRARELLASVTPLLVKHNVNITLAEFDDLMSNEPECALNWILIAYGELLLSGESPPREMIEAVRMAAKAENFPELLSECDSAVELTYDPDLKLPSDLSSLMEDAPYRNIGDPSEVNQAMLADGVCRLVRVRILRTLFGFDLKSAVDVAGLDP